MTPTNLASLVESTKHQMAAITGLHCETVSQFDQAESGYKMNIDMLEYRSIPRTQDLLSSFEVMLDGSGAVTRWRRTGRFTRGEHS